MVQFYLDYVILLSRMSITSSFKTKLSDILINVMKVCTCSLIMDHIPRHLKPKIMQRQIKKRVPTNKWRWNESWILCLALCWPICLGLNILMTTFISDASGFCWNLVSKLIKFQAIIRQDMNWHFFLMLVSSKGQWISKSLFGVLNSSKKWTKTIRPEVS